MNHTIWNSFIRGLRYALKPGNFLYYFLFALELTLGDFIDFRYRLAAINSSNHGYSPLTLGIEVLVLCVCYCKFFDNVARILVGLEREPVPFRLLSEISFEQLMRYFFGHFLFALYLLLLLIIAYALNLKILILLGLFVWSLLLSAITLSFLENNTIRSMRSILCLRDIITNIGTGRYIIVLILTSLISYLAVSSHYALFSRVMQSVQFDLLKQIVENKSTPALSTIFYCYIFISSLILAFIGNLYWTLWACIFHREDETEEEQQLSDSFDVAKHEHLSTQIDSGYHVYKEYSGMIPQGNRIGDEPVVPSSVDVPVDLSVLVDADTRGMGIGKQKDFARKLIQADELFKKGNIEEGIAILRPYVDKEQDAAAYFPAYQRIYALQPQSDLLERLITAATGGNLHCYNLIRPELNALDPATLDADIIYPLARLAAKQQHYDTVLALTRHFAKHHPTHSHIADNYFLAAQALEKIGASDKAQQLLQQLLKRFPESGQAERMRQLLERIQMSQNR